MTLQLFRVLMIAMVTISVLAQAIELKELFRLHLRDEFFNIYVSLEEPASIARLEEVVCEILGNEHLDKGSFKRVRIYFFVGLDKYVPNPLPTADEVKSGEKSLGVYFWNRQLVANPDVHELRLYRDTELRRYELEERPSKKFDFVSQCPPR